MFNINKIINRIRDPERARDSPPQSPSRKLDEPDVEESAEGFLCPTCMTGFPSPEDLQAHYEDVHTESENQGQLCPVCRMKMKTTRELQEHYAAHHVTTKNGDLETLKQELAELQTTLREEKWYSDDLKREVERLQVTVNSKGDGDKGEAENLYKIQIKSLEETKSLLSSEVMLLRKQLAEAVETNMSIKQEKEKIEIKAASMASDLVGLKATADQELSVKTLLEDELKIAQEKIVTLEAELQQRPEADDVAVLRQELIQVQTLMNKTTIEREQEKEQLEADFQNLKDRYAELQRELKIQEAKLQDAPKAEELESLKAVLSQSSSGTVQLQESLKNKISEYAALDKKFFSLGKEQAATLAELKAKTKKCEELEKDLGAKESEARETRDKLKEKSALCLKLEQKITQTTEALKSHEMELTEAQTSNSNLRQSLQQQLLEKEQQLNQVNLQLEKTVALLAERQSQSEDLNRQLNTLQSHFQEQTVEISELKSALWEKDNQIEADTRQLDVSNAKQKELEECISSYKERTERLEGERTELHAKIESGEGAATVIQQLTQEAISLQEKLTEQQQQTEMQAQKSAKKLEKLHKLLQETKNQLQNSNENCRKFEVTLKDMSAELTASQDKVAKLESELKVKIDQMHTNDASQANLKAELENRSAALQMLLDEKEVEVQKLKEKRSETQDELNKQMKANENLQSDLAGEINATEKLQEKYEKLECVLKEKSEEIIKFGQAEENLKSQLNDASSRLATAESSLQDKEESLKSLTKSANEIRHKMENQIHRMEAERTELLNTKNSLEKEIAETCDDVARKMAELHESHHRITTEKMNLEREFEEHKSQTAAEVNQLKEMLSRSQSSETERQAKLKSATELIKSLEDKIVSLESARSNLLSNLTSAEEKVKEKDCLLENHVTDLTKLRTELGNKDKFIADLQTQLEGVQVTLETEVQSVKMLQDQLMKLQKSYEEAATKCTEADKLLEKTRLELSENQQKQDKLASDLEKSVANEDALSKSLEDLNQVKTLLGQEMIKMDSEFKNAVEEQQQLILQKTSLETELFNKQKELSEMEEKVFGFERSCLEANQRLEDERQTHEEEASGLMAAKQLLFHQKTELQDQLSATELNLAEERKNHAQTKESLQSDVENLESELQRVTQRLEESESAHLAVVRDKEEKETRLRTEVGALNENVTTLRADLKSEQSKAVNLESSVSSLSGEKLDLEARLENALDERRALLERCLASESECDQLRNSSTDLRHKLDEALAAVHELGRENQTLQIESAKLTSRKWADDSEAASCTLCQKIFSVTIRKHHCRNCGNIFCSECSTRSATVASSKKPVRVCDLCYAEMSK